MLSHIAEMCRKALSETPPSDRITGIDGLRAIAVLSILLYHLNSAWLPGGFAGVDVFFVISGFVVARSSRSLASENFKCFAYSFYRRRVLRIFPAVAFFTLAALLFSSLFIPIAEHTSNFGLMGVSSLFALSNFVFLLTHDAYFQSQGSYNPFLHMWSLAVEEQYYILFPLFAYLLLSKNATHGQTRRRILFLFVALVVLSLLACGVLTGKAPSIAFFMLPPRLWELGVGFILYLLTARKVTETESLKILHRTLAILCPVGLLASYIFISDRHFPYPWALLPCLSTAGLIFVISRHPESILSRFLSMPPILWVGSLSYSLYLWHWGVIVGMRWTTGMSHAYQYLSAAALILALSSLSYYVIEKPIRYSSTIRAIPSKQFSLGFAICFTAIAMLSASIVYFRSSISLSVTRDTQSWLNHSFPPEACPAHIAKHRFFPGSYVQFSPAGCIPSTQRQLFLAGDSHTAAYYRTAYRLASEDGIRVQLWSLGGCSFVGVQSKVSPIASCPQYRQRAIQSIAAQAKPGDVVVLSSLQIKRYRDYWDSPIEGVSPDDSLVQAQDKALAMENAATLKPLSDAGMFVFIELPKPAMVSALFRCADWYDKHNEYCSSSFLATRTELLHRSARNRFYLEDVSKMLPNSRVWNTLDVLCEGEVCPGYKDGHPIYVDTDHLSGYGNDLVYKNLVNQLKELPAKP